MVLVLPSHLCLHQNPTISPQAIRDHTSGPACSMLILSATVSYNLHKTHSLDTYLKSNTSGRSWQLLG